MSGSYLNVTIKLKGLREDTLQKILEKQYPEAAITVKRVTPPTSRSERYDAALSDIENAKSEIENLRDEVDEWKNSIPDNLQGGDKYQTLESTYDELSSMADELESAVGHSPEFPGMMG